MKHIVFILLIFVLSAGCVENFDLKLNSSEPRLVVEGLVSNRPGPYYVRLTKSKTNNITSPEDSREENVEPILDATVIIKDDLNQIDTLKVIDIDMTGYIYSYEGCYKPIYDENGKIVDKIFISSDIAASNKKGYYRTSRLTGLVGHNYYLKIMWKGKEFEASTYMPSVPEIESVGYQMKIAEKDGQEYYIPLLNFKEPQGIKNYYLIQLDKENYHYSGYPNTNWNFSILADTQLDSYVKDLNVSLVSNPRGFESITYGRGDSIYVVLNSLTQKDYNYYKNLIDQFANDGGSYKPSPSTPPGNISNGALGLFRASAISEGKVKIRN